MTTKKTKKNNCQLNKGFTLIEVLVAVIILAIVCIPVFKAFVTSANTTAKSKQKMRATNAAENIMEDIQNLNLDQIIEKYGTAGTDKANYVIPAGDPDYNVNPAAMGASAVSYRIDFNTAKTGYDEDVNKALNDGYSASIIIDPSWYTNSNRVNMPEFDVVGNQTAAIFSMSPSEMIPGISTLDYEACQFFQEKNQDYHDDNPSADLLNASDFAKIIKREIRVDVVKNGVVTDEDGNLVDQVTVNLKVMYLVTKDDVLDEKYKTRTALTRQLFSNGVTKKPLESVFLMYYPLYEDGLVSNPDRDIIVVQNKADAEFNLYVAAQNEGAGEKWEKYIDKTKNPGLILEIYENKVSGKEPITLRTNLVDTSKVEYMRDETKSADEHIIPINCNLNVASLTNNPQGMDDPFDKVMYGKLTASTKKGGFEDKNVSKALNAQCLDGKTLDASTITDRIFDVKVRVTKPTGADEWPVSVELTGSLTQEIKEE